MKKRKSVCRPKLPVRRVKLTTTLPPVTVKWLRAIGTGNISRAIEGLVRDELIRYPTWEQLAKDNGYWDESMKIRPVNQS